MLSLTLCFFSIILAITIWIFSRRKNNQPGPFKLPIIGNIHQVWMASSYPPEAFDKLCRKYGKIIHLQVGTMNTIVLSKYEDIRELYTRPELVEREHKMELLKDRNFHENLGLAFGNGEMYSTIRSFSMKNLKDFGFGNSSSMEIAIQDEVQEFIKYIENKMKENQGVVEVSYLFMPITLNVTWQFATGSRFSYDNEKMTKILHMSHDALKTTRIFGPAVAFPILRDLFPNWFGKNAQLQIIKESQQFLQDEIRERAKNEDRRMNPKSFVDVFINKIESDKGNPDSFFTENQLVITLMDLFQGGSDTTSSALEHAFRFLILNQRVQKKVQAEIDEKIPANTVPNLDHKSQLIYTQATIYEILRCGPVIPLPMPRVALKDIYHDGFLIEKGASVTANLHSVMHSEQVWGDPETFRPERFINKENGTLDKTLIEKVNVFGHGKRFCMGEHIALAQMFMIITTLLQKWTFHAAPGRPAITTEVEVGLTMNPKPYATLIKVRTSA